MNVLIQQIVQLFPPASGGRQVQRARTCSAFLAMFMTLLLTLGGTTKAKADAIATSSTIVTIESTGAAAYNTYDAYVIKNKSTGRYLSLNGSSLTTKTTADYTCVVKFSAASTSTTTQIQLYNGNYLTLTTSVGSGSSGTSLTKGTQSGYLGFRVTVSTSTYRLASNSSNRITSTTTNNDYALWQVYKVTSPMQGSYVRIHNKDYSNVLMGGGASTKTVTGADGDASNYYQVWKVTNSSASSFTFQNAVSDQYVQEHPSTDYSQPYYMGSTASSYTLAAVTNNSSYSGTFTFTDNSPSGLHEDASHNLVSWYSYSNGNEGNFSTASCWYFETVNVDATALAAARAEYSDVNSINDNASTYNTTLGNLFTDKSCSELSSTAKAYTTAQWNSAISSLPTAVQTMANKVKNATWTTYSGLDKTEENFRIASFGATSNHSEWTSIVGFGYSLGRLNNPTGVYAENGDLLQIYVDQIPSGATVKLEIVGFNQALGTTFDLNAGINQIQASQAGNVFVFYEVDNFNNSKTTFTELSSYPSIKVHIEGGTINGFLDFENGDTEDTWTTMKGLKSSTTLVNKETFIIKCSHSLFNAWTATAIASDNLYEATKVSDDILIAERELYGVEGENASFKYDSKPYSAYFNNRLTVKNQVSGNPYATTYGISVGYSDYPNVLQYNTTRGLKNYADAVWCMAHEFGHHHQKNINMVGNTEVSNNVYSNVGVYNQGVYTSRTAGIQTQFSNFHNGTPWIADGSSTCYVSNNQLALRLNYDLWLYFYKATTPDGNKGYDHTFFQRLNKALKDDPMVHSTNTWINASDDYLKYYVKCCEVSGLDLTDFFASFGFFVIPTTKSYTVNSQTKNGIKVSDYGDYYLYITQEQIDAAKAKVKAMNLPKGNLLFLEDRISATDAEGNTRTINPDGEVSAIGNKSQVGELGQYTTFGEEITGTYKYAVSGTTVTVGGDGAGAVGFKIYDADGNLVWAANTSSFTVSSAVATALNNGTYHIVAAQGDGTDVSATTGAMYKLTYKIYDPAGNYVTEYSDDVLDGAQITDYFDDIIALKQRYVVLPEFEEFYMPKAAKIVDVHVTYNLPFVVSTEENPSYTYLFNSGRNLYANTNEDAEGRNTFTSVKDNSDDHYQWAFYGNPFDGFQIRNKAVSGNLYGGSTFDESYNTTCENAPLLSTENSTSWIIQSQAAAT